MFLSYLHDWEEEIANKEGYNAKQRAKMLLSRETMEGLRITGIHLTHYNNVIFMSDSACVTKYTATD